MKILLIIEREGPAGGISWVTDAVDEWTLDDAGMPAALRERVNTDPNVRTAWVSVPDDLFDLVWATPEVQGTVVDG